MTSPQMWILHRCGCLLGIALPQNSKYEVLSKGNLQVASFPNRPVLLNRCRMPSHRITSLFRALLVAGLPSTAAYAQVQVAESLLVNLNASTFNNGDTDWLNTGSLTGNFNVDGTRPVRTTADGVTGLF